ncbi:MAG: cold shock domain-containing protein [Acetilactobacillus jinshanensis]
MIGKVVRYNNARGFGFIKDQTWKKIFVNYTAIENTAHRSLKVGQKVKFAVAQGLRGPQAVKVNPIK